MQYTCKLTSRCFREIIIDMKKKLTYSEFVSVALVIQQPEHMPRIVLSSMTCLVISKFPHYLKSGTIFVKNFLDLKFLV